MAAKLRYIHIIQYYAARKRSLEMSRISKSIEIKSSLEKSLGVWEKMGSDTHGYRAFGG